MHVTFHNNPMITTLLSFVFGQVGAEMTQFVRGQDLYGSKAEVCPPKDGKHPFTLTTHPNDQLLSNHQHPTPQNDQQHKFPLSVNNTPPLTDH